MTDYIAFLTSPIGITMLTVLVCAPIVAWAFRLGAKKEMFAILDRLKPSTEESGGRSSLYMVNRIKSARNKEGQVTLPDKTKMTIPDESLAMADTLTIRKKVTLKVGTYYLLGKEAGNLVGFSKSLADASRLMMDNKSMTIVINRASLVTLARGAAGTLAENWVYIVLGVMAGVSVGWILYPEFNHLPPVVECFTRLGNGTMRPSGCA